MQKGIIYYRHTDLYEVIRVSQLRIKFRIYKQICFDLLEIIYRGKDISVTQFIDSNQNQIPSKERIKTLQALYDLKIEIPDIPLENKYFYKNAKVYNLHIFGKINQGWLTQIINFGALSIPNIFWGDNLNMDVTEIDYSEWDELLLRQYQSNNSEISFLKLLASQSIICLTIGSEFNILSKDENLTRKTIRIIEELTKLYGYAFSLNEFNEQSN